MRDAGQAASEAELVSWTGSIAHLDSVGYGHWLKSLNGASPLNSGTWTPQQLGSMSLPTRPEGLADGLHSFTGDSTSVNDCWDWMPSIHHPQPSARGQLQSESYGGAALQHNGKTSAGGKGQFEGLLPHHLANAALAQQQSAGAMLGLLPAGAHAAAGSALRQFEQPDGIGTSFARLAQVASSSGIAQLQHSLTSLAEHAASRSSGYMGQASRKKPASSIGRLGQDSSPENLMDSSATNTKVAHELPSDLCIASC